MENSLSVSVCSIMHNIQPHRLYLKEILLIIISWVTCHRFKMIQSRHLGKHLIPHSVFPALCIPLVSQLLVISINSTPSRCKMKSQFYIILLNQTFWKSPWKFVCNEIRTRPLQKKNWYTEAVQGSSNLGNFCLHRKLSRDFMNTLKEEDNSWLSDLLVGKIGIVVPAEAILFLFFTTAQYILQPLRRLNRRDWLKSFVTTSNFIMFAVYKVVFSWANNSNTAQCCGMRRKRRKRVRERKKEGKIIWEAVSFILNTTLLYINAWHNFCSQWKGDLYFTLL